MSKELSSPDMGLRLYTFDEAKQIVDNARYTITDLAIKDTKGKVGFTISITRLKRGQQTRGHEHPEWEVYEYMEGSGVMMYDGNALMVKAGDVIFIEPGRYHKVINISNSTDLTFRCYAVGKINRPQLALGV